eukprot:gene12497-12631_t
MHTTSEGGTQLLDVNCSVLDSLVLDYLTKEELIEDTPNDLENLLQRKAAAFAAYQQLQQGQVGNTLAIVEQFCPNVLQDQRLAFKLKRQQFIELLRRGDPAGDAAALGCTSPTLASLLTYLLLLFEQYVSGSHGSSRAGSSSQAQIQQLLAAGGAELATGLLLKGRDAAPLPPDLPWAGHAERDVQALMAAVNVSRQTAVDALKAATGDLSVALAHQLQCLKLDHKLLDVLLWEYACERCEISHNSADC